MGFSFRKSRKIGKSTRLNIGGRGASVSKKFGPFRISSRGNVSVRLGKGLSFRKKLF